jgi:ABC-2 type transport system permease protein
MGFHLTHPAGLLAAFFFMVLISFTFIGFGLIFASLMKDMQGFGIIINFIIFPLFFLSGALYPLKNLPWIIRALSYADPLTYGIDGLRGVLIGVNSLPIIADFLILAGFALVMLFLGAWFFEKSESV